MAVVPYTANEVENLMAALGPELYRDSKWAARKIGKAFKAGKSSRKAKRAKGNPYVGGAPTMVSSKREEVSSVSNVDKSSKTLYNTDLTVISRSTGEDDRVRGLINAKGIKIGFHVYNKLNQVIFCNVAVLSPKHNYDINLPTAEFFKGTGATRGMDFAASQTGLEQYMLPVNTDRWAVTKHHRFELGPNTSGTDYWGNTGKANYATKKLWIPINRQLRYQDTGSLSCTTPIRLYYWFSFADDDSAAPPTAAVANVSEYHTMIFTDVV